MTFIEFIKSKLSVNSPVGDLANDIQRDENFPVTKSTQEIINYIKFHTSMRGTDKAFKQLLRQYKKHLLDNPINDKLEDTLKAKFSVMRIEQWKFYKDHFLIDKVYLIGDLNDIYKVFCVNSKSGTALYFDIKSRNDLNDIPLVDEENIYIGHATKQTTAKEAIQILENCSYDNTPIKPNEENFSELVEFLRKNNGQN